MEAWPAACAGRVAGLGSADVRKQLTYANVMATIAVFIALGGGAYALSLPKNSVGPRQLKTNAVTGHDALESSFSQVPSAAHADTATHADSASQADSAATAANASNAANADKLDNLDSSDIGLGFLTGRVDNLDSTSGTKGSPPTGLSAGTTDTTLAGENLTLSPNRVITMRDLDVLLSAPVTCSGICGPSENVTITLQALDGAGAPSASLACSIVSGADACTAAGPSGSVAAGSRLRLVIAKSGDAGFAAGADAMFSWRATAP
jgi:hypothetical protein